MRTFATLSLQESLNYEDHHAKRHRCKLLKFLERDIVAIMSFLTLLPSRLARSVKWTTVVILAGTVALVVLWTVSSSLLPSDAVSQPQMIY
jgi:hypothetical protein